MQLTPLRFRIQNFRSVNDSGWIELDSVTALIGRNDSGKSNLLRALSLFNPPTADAYIPQRDFPRNCYPHEYNSDLPVCTIAFEIDDAFLDELTHQIQGSIEIPKEIKVTKNYNSKFSIVDALRMTRNTIESLGDALDKLKDSLDTDIQLLSDSASPDSTPAQDIHSLRQPIKQLQRQLRQMDQNAATEHISISQRILTHLQNIKHPHLDNRVERVRQLADQLVNEASHDETLEQQFVSLISGALPVTIYFNDYDFLPGTISLPQYLQNVSQGASDSNARTISALFKHADIDPNKLEELRSALDHDGADDALATRRQLLHTASLAVSKEVNTFYQQSSYTIKYDVDHQYVRVLVADDSRPNLETNLNERSLGFQWYFSFLLVFLAESDREHRNAMLLLDEPGLHLHGEAQQDLLRAFEHIAKNHRLIYTTHSPFMIDRERLDRVRILELHNKEMHVIADGDGASDLGAIFPLRAAAGYALMSDMIRRATSVLVEGLSDRLHLEALNTACRAAGYKSLPPDILFLPCDGTSNVKAIAHIFASEEIWPVVLLDGDKEGKVAYNSLKSKAFRDAPDKLILLSDIVKRPDEPSIEDLVGVEALKNSLEHLKENRNKYSENTHVDIDNIDAALNELESGQGRSLPRSLKAPAATALKELVHGEGACEVYSKSTLDQAENLFVRICELFNLTPLQEAHSDE